MPIIDYRVSETGLAIISHSGKTFVRDMENLICFAASCADGKFRPWFPPVRAAYEERKVA